MYDCHQDIVAFHNEKVVLSIADRDEMRKRRDSNRNRVESGLKTAGQPAVKEFRSQGSYAMWTMVQDANNDYDIDDGVYFTKESLVGPQGGDKSAYDARAMVRDAVASEQFKKQPEVRKNCVRVYYEVGYHVDLPVYRKIQTDDGQTQLELASAEWRASDPQSVTEWLRKADRAQSPDSGDSVGQLRRIVRMLKAFSRSRDSWKDKIATGFMLSVLVVEKYAPAKGREDRALYDSMVAIRDRLKGDLKIKHPTVAGEYLSKGESDGRVKFLREKLDWAVTELQPLFSGTCSREDALAAWDKVFATSFFGDRLSGDDSSGKGGASAGIPLVRKPRPTRPVDKRGGGRYA